MLETDDLPAAVPERRRKYDERCVYFVVADGAGLVKIGVTNDVHARMAAMKTNSPLPLRLLGMIRSVDAEALEESLHRKFAAHRQHGEWFAVHPDVLAAIDELAISAGEDAQRLIDRYIGRQQPEPPDGADEWSFDPVTFAAARGNRRTMAVRLASYKAERGLS